jgi:hypothetical protein
MQRKHNALAMQKILYSYPSPENKKERKRSKRMKCSAKRNLSK